MKILLISGPPRAGKDTAMSAILHSQHDNLFHLRRGVARFSAPLKHIAASILPSIVVDDTDGNLIDEVTREEVDKETPNPILGVSLRQFQIDMGEKFMKPRYGRSIFARLLLSRIPYYAPNIDLLLIPDAGFQIEVDTLLEATKTPEFMYPVGLLRILRPGTSYQGDSREVLYPYDSRGRLRCWYEIVLNDVDKQSFESRCIDAALRFLTSEFES